MKKILQVLKNLIKKIFLKKKITIQRFVPIEKDFLGRKLYIHDIASFNLCNKELFVEEMYNFVAKRTNPYIIDCGANLGMSIIYFKENHPDAKIIAFEADEHIFSFLKRNVESFEYKDVDLVNKAVWNKDDVLTFLVEGGAGGRLEEKTETGIYKDVPCISLRSYLTDKKVDFLKLDIEGSEYEVLKDCEDLLTNVENLFIEYHSMPDVPQNLHQILTIVQKAGFNYHIKEAYTAKHPFIERKLNFGMDLQLNIFCYKN
jgi:FkbM family methyltransferase